MKHLYLVVLGAGFDREVVVKYLESLPGMGTWFYSMPFSFFIESSLSAQHLSGLIKGKFSGPNLSHFVTRISADRQGWMPPDHWERFYQADK